MMAAQTIERNYRAAQVAMLLGVSESFVYKERQAGRFPASMKYGNGEKGWRWTEQDIAVYRAKNNVNFTIPVDEPKQRYRPGKREIGELRLVK